MKTSTKIWLWFALVLCAATTVMNACFGRWPSVIVAIVSLAGLCMVLFAKKKAGFALMCCCYVVSFFVAVLGSLGQPGLLVSIIMSLVGSLLVPVITWLLLRRDWDSLNCGASFPSLFSPHFHTNHSKRAAEYSAALLLWFV